MSAGRAIDARINTSLAFVWVVRALRAKSTGGRRAAVAAGRTPFLRRAAPFGAVRASGASDTGSIARRAFVRVVRARPTLGARSCCGAEAAGRTQCCRRAPFGAVSAVIGAVDAGIDACLALVRVKRARRTLGARGWCVAVAADGARVAVRCSTVQTITD